MELRNTRGQRIVLALPDSPTFAELAPAATSYQRLLDGQHEAQERLAQLHDERTAAVDADRDTVAAALSSGKPLPKDDAVQKIDRAIADTERLIAGFDRALDEAERELVDAIAERRDAWLAAEHERLEQAASAYMRAVDALEQATQELADPLGVITWLRHIEERPTFVARTAPPALLALPGPSGDPYTWPDVLAALRAARPAPARVEIPA